MWTLWQSMTELGKLALYINSFPDKHSCRIYFFLGIWLSISGSIALFAGDWSHLKLYDYNMGRAASSENWIKQAKSSSTDSPADEHGDVANIHVDASINTRIDAANMSGYEKQAHWYLPREQVCYIWNISNTDAKRSQQWIQVTSLCDNVAESNGLWASAGSFTMQPWLGHSSNEYRQKQIHNIDMGLSQNRLPQILMLNCLVIIFPTKMVML